MLPKALFLSTIEKIRQQKARIDEFDKALSKMCDGFPAFDKDNLYLLALRDLLKYTMQEMQMQIDILKETINVLKKDPGVDEQVQ